MSKLGFNKEHQKKSNRGLVLKLVATGQCTSRIELARKTGLTKTAISQIVNELIGKDYLVETEKESTSEIGRNPVGLGISPAAPSYAGVLIQRGFCEAVLCDMQLHIRKSEKIEQNWTDADALTKGVYQLLDHMLEGEDNVAGIGIASIGSVNVAEGTIVRPYYFNGIRNVRIRDLVRDRCHLPVFFDHDNQSAALAEQLYGNGRGYQDILVIGVSQGVGCGILVNGERMHSCTGYAPEIGHISIDYNGPRCICGNAGCLEQYINSGAMMEQFRKISGMDLNYAQFCQMTDHPGIRQVMEQAIKKLSMAIVSTLNILNSQIVLLCMDCCFWPDKYIQMIEEEINRRKFGNLDVFVPVRKTFFLHQSQVLGAACNAISHTFLGELP